MGQILQGSARTTAAVRSAIEHSQDSLIAQHIQIVAIVSRLLMPLCGMAAGGGQIPLQRSAWCAPQSLIRC